MGRVATRHEIDFLGFPGSIVNAEFTLDRDQAFDLRSSDFLGKGNGLNNPFLQNFDMVYFVRVEYLPMSGSSFGSGITTARIQFQASL